MIIAMRNLVLFSGCVISGLHWLPLLEGSPSASFLHRLRTSGPVKKIFLDAAMSEDIVPVVIITS